MEKDILKAFLYDKKLKFNEIEKRLKTRSNKLSYHMKNLERKGILLKEDEHYSLSEKGNRKIPYLSEDTHALPVILIHIGNKGESFLIKRKKRPFKDKLGMPGGRLLIDETLKDAVKRIMKNKYNINAGLKKTNSVSMENIKNEKKTIQTDIIIFVSATANAELTNLKENKKDIIESDYRLIKEDVDKEVEVKILNTKD